MPKTNTTKRFSNLVQRTLDQDQASKLLASFHPGISEDYSNQARRFTLCDLDQPLGIRNHAIIWLLLDSGFRSSELCHLELSRLNLVERSATGLVKFGKWRTAIFSAVTAQALTDWVAIRSEFETQTSAGRLFIGVMN